MCENIHVLENKVFISDMYGYTIKGTNCDPEKSYLNFSNNLASHTYTGGFLIISEYDNDCTSVDSLTSAYSTGYGLYFDLISDKFKLSNYVSVSNQIGVTGITHSDKANDAINFEDIYIVGYDKINKITNCVKNLDFLINSFDIKIGVIVPSIIFKTDPSRRLMDFLEERKKYLSYPLHENYSNYTNTYAYIKTDKISFVNWDDKDNSRDCNNDKKYAITNNNYQKWISNEMIVDNINIQWVIEEQFAFLFDNDLTFNCIYDHLNSTVLRQDEELQDIFSENSTQTTESTEVSNVQDEIMEEKYTEESENKNCTEKLYSLLYFKTFLPQKFTVYEFYNKALRYFNPYMSHREYLIENYEYYSTKSKAYTEFFLEFGDLSKINENGISSLNLGLDQFTSEYSLNFKDLTILTTSTMFNFYSDYFENDNNICTENTVWNSGNCKDNGLVNLWINSIYFNTSEIISPIRVLYPNHYQEDLINDYDDKINYTHTNFGYYIHKIDGGYFTEEKFHLVLPMLMTKAMNKTFFNFNHNKFPTVLEVNITHIHDNPEIEQYNLLKLYIETSIIAQTPLDEDMIAKDSSFTEARISYSTYYIQLDQDISYLLYANLKYVQRKIFQETVSGETPLTEACGNHMFDPKENYLEFIASDVFCNINIVRINSLKLYFTFQIEMFDWMGKEEDQNISYKKAITDSLEIDPKYIEVVYNLLAPLKFVIFIYEFNPEDYYNYIIGDLINSDNIRYSTGLYDNTGMGTPGRVLRENTSLEDKGETGNIQQILENETLYSEVKNLRGRYIQENNSTTTETNTTGTGSNQSIEDYIETQRLKGDREFAVVNLFKISELIKQKVNNNEIKFNTTLLEYDYQFIINNDLNEDGPNNRVIRGVHDYNYTGNTSGKIVLDFRNDSLDPNLVDEDNSTVLYTNGTHASEVSEPLESGDYPSEKSFAEEYFYVLIIIALLIICFIIFLVHFIKKKNKENEEQQMKEDKLKQSIQKMSELEKDTQEDNQGSPKEVSKGENENSEKAEEPKKEDRGNEVNDSNRESNSEEEIKEEQVKLDQDEYSGIVDKDADKSKVIQQIDHSTSKVENIKPKEERGKVKVMEYIETPDLVNPLESEKKLKRGYDD
eukprot:CAMPEP_0170528588 /NCGR_PEP_ID=MMETSP0209-20121228/14099_1 /TAXON_ID=665100 ORGANISM="Litonotus pictus, Strain P1" /NCGR_SAMPLE_ID=MMETSP0209 /ASSEMBLY_ACC=CAM_ASM_000301 /LENGTH=1119 /DNA_ID=CAMNT_0010819929 /DNA_START=4897 /DNA_END=8256 /DNA_ORIENTATION=+